MVKASECEQKIGTVSGLFSTVKSRLVRKFDFLATSMIVVPER